MVLYYILLPLAWLVFHIGFRSIPLAARTCARCRPKAASLPPTTFQPLTRCSSSSAGSGAGGCSFFAKKELFEINVLLTWFFRCCGALCVRGTKEELEIIDRTVEACRAGETLLIFRRAPAKKRAGSCRPRAACSSLRRRPGWMWCRCASATIRRTGRCGCSAG